MHRGVVAGGNLGDEQQHPVEHDVEIDILIQSLGQGVVHDRNRAHPTHGLVERFPGLVAVRSPALDAQQRGNRLQVVLHPVVDLADGGILRDQFAFLMPHLGDVTAQHDGADALAPVADRDGAQRHRHPARLDVGAPRCPAGDHERQRLVDDELAAAAAGS